MASKDNSNTNTMDKLTSTKGDKFAAYVTRSSDYIYRPSPIIGLTPWPYLHGIRCGHDSKGRICDSSTRPLPPVIRPRSCRKCLRHTWWPTRFNTRIFLEPRRRIAYAPQAEADRRRGEAKKEAGTPVMGAAGGGGRPKGKARSRIWAAVELKDDPIEEGKWLANDGLVRLPSDRVENEVRVAATEERLIDVEAEMTMDDIRHHEPAYTVKLAKRRNRGRGGGGGRTHVEGARDVQDGAPVPDEVAGEPAIMFEDLVKGQVHFWPGTLGLRLAPAENEDAMSVADSWVEVDDVEDVDGVD